MINNGNIFYQDEYQTLYDIVWETIGSNLDITSIVSQPFVWGERPRGYVKNNRVFRWGIITVTRQIFRILSSGYEMIAEGSAQYYDYVQTNFLCETVPADNFLHHLDCALRDDIELRVSNGSQYTDPDVPDSFTIWCDLFPDGTPVVGTGPVLEWIDVWA